MCVGLQGGPQARDWSEGAFRQAGLLIADMVVLNVAKAALRCEAVGHRLRGEHNRQLGNSEQRQRDEAIRRAVVLSEHKFWTQICGVREKPQKKASVTSEDCVSEPYIFRVLICQAQVK